MTLVERCQNLRSQIDVSNALRRAHKEAEAFRERTSEVKGVRGSLVDALEKVRVLRTKGAAVGKLPDLTSTKNSLQDYQRKLAGKLFERGGRDYGYLKRSIDKIARELIAVAVKALESLKQDVPTIEEAFLRQVELIPGYADRVAHIRRERDSLLGTVDPRAMGAEELAQFLDRRDGLSRLADELKPNEFPKEVIDFFRAARHGGAPYGKLTATVQQWLGERDQLKNIRITVIGR